MSEEMVLFAKIWNSQKSIIPRHFILMKGNNSQILTSMI